MVHRINRWVGMVCAVVSGCALVFMALIAFVDSIGRQLNHPLQGADEMVVFALCTFFFASVALVVRDDGHIRVGLFAELYKPRLARMERYFTAVVEVLLLIFFCWMIYDQADRLARFGTVSFWLKMPIAPWVYLAFALSVIAIWFAIQNLWTLRNTPTPRPHAIPDEER